MNYFTIINKFSIERAFFLFSYLCVVCMMNKWKIRRGTMLKCTHVCGQQFFAGWKWRKGNEIERKGSENKSWINFSQQKQKFESCKVFKYTGKIFKWIISFYDHIIKFRNRSGNLTLYPEVCFHLMNQEFFPSTTMIKMLTTIERSKKS